MQPTVTAKSIIVKLNYFQISQVESEREKYWGTPYISVNAHILEYGNLDTYQKEYQLAVKILKILEARAHMPLDSVVFTSKSIRDNIQKAIKDSGLYEQSTGRSNE